MDLWSFGGSVCHGYMCILLYVKLNGCNGVSWISGQLEGGVNLPWVYVHSSICEAYWVYWCSIDLWSIGGGSICHGYMCILLYMKLIGCNGFAWIYGQLGGPSAIGICAFCYRCNLLGVMVLHTSMLIWWGSICHWYLCILL